MKKSSVRRIASWKFFTKQDHTQLNKTPQGHTRRHQTTRKESFSSSHRLLGFFHATISVPSSLSNSQRSEDPSHSLDFSRSCFPLVFISLTMSARWRWAISPATPYVIGVVRDAFFSGSCHFFGSVDVWPLHSFCSVSISDFFNP